VNETMRTSGSVTTASPVSRPPGSNALAAGCRAGAFTPGNGGQCAAANWAVSVDPSSATVEDFGVMAEATRSKYPVPTSRWCLVAV
jgi:hypothetical protein